MATEKQIFVTQPSLPPLKEFIPYLEKIWESKILTNGGFYHHQLEEALCEYLGVKYVSLFNNGTIALITALKALELKGEVITTPYSFVATSHSIVWNDLVPIFVDINPDTLNLDPGKIVEAITPRTSAILPVHCYGIPCSVESIKEISEKHNLKVIYDAAHAFGVKDSAGSILRHGDLSILSFHATKVFNTFEGGAIVSHSKEMKAKIDSLKNFGYESEVSITSFGLNGKMPEINAAFGLLQLNYVNDAIENRKIIDNFYRTKINNITGLRLIDISNIAAHNFSYFPIVIEPEYGISRDELHTVFREHGIVTRKYFNPLITDFEVYRNQANRCELNIAKCISSKILCLPIYPNLETEKQQLIVTILEQSGVTR